MRRQTSLTVLMENVHKEHNYSAVLRTCDAVGVYRAHAVAPLGPVGTFSATSASASKWVQVQRHQDCAEAFAALRNEGFRVLAAHLSPQAVDFRAIDYTQPSAILLGAELEGVTSQAAELADAHIIIPMHGLVQSLNVSVAASIILYEAQRQRQAAGLYEQQQVPPDDLTRVLFEWAHPKIARRCRDKGAAYPAVDDDGLVVGDFPR